jgi:F0F1-type ATP synthase assembly protein I
MENSNLLEAKKTLLWCSIVDIGLFVLSSFCFFIDQMWIPLGFLLGGLFSNINYIVLYYFTGLLLKPFARRRLLSTSLYFIRMILYVLGLFICVFLQSKGYNIFFFGTCLASYLINIIVLVVVNHIKDKKKEIKNNEN